MKKLVLHGEIPVNCYVIEQEGDCYIVDPGYEKEKIIAYVDQNKLNVIGILLTHGHIDHIGAIDAFKVPVYLHENEIEVIKDNEKNGFSYFDKMVPYDINKIQFKVLKNGDRLPLGNQLIEVIHTPGHTVGSVCFRVEHTLYTGDTLFQGTVGKWTFPTGDLLTLMHSIITLIDEQDNSMIIYPAHGESSTIQDEKESNPYYLLWKQEINR